MDKKFKITKNVLETYTTTTSCLDKTFSSAEEAKDYIHKEIADIFSNTVKHNYQVFYKDDHVIEFNTDKAYYKIWFRFCAQD